MFSSGILFLQLQLLWWLKRSFQLLDLIRCSNERMMGLVVFLVHLLWRSQQTTNHVLPRSSHCRVFFLFLKHRCFRKIKLFAQIFPWKNSTMVERVNDKASLSNHVLPNCLKGDVKLIFSENNLVRPFQKLVNFA